MTKLLIKRFIKDYENTQNSDVRTAYGKFSSIVGIVCNAILFISKLIVGTLSAISANRVDRIMCMTVYCVIRCGCTRCPAVRNCSRCWRTATTTKGRDSDETKDSICIDKCADLCGSSSLACTVHAYAGYSRDCGRAGTPCSCGRYG